MFRYLCCLFGLQLLVIANVKDVEQLIDQLGAIKFTERKAAKKELFKLYDSQPDILDKLFLRAYGGGEKDPEVKVSAQDLVKEIVLNKVFVEKGCLGISMEDMKVSYVEPGGPAAKAGMKSGWVLKKIQGQDCTGKDFNFVVAIIHKTRPGQKIKMHFVDENDKEVIIEPVAAPRSQIRSDEDVEMNKKLFLENWLSEKKSELQKK